MIEALKKIDWLTREALNAFDTLSPEDAEGIARSALKDILAILLQQAKSWNAPPYAPDTFTARKDPSHD